MQAPCLSDRGVNSHHQDLSVKRLAFIRTTRLFFGLCVGLIGTTACETGLSTELPRDVPPQSVEAGDGDSAASDPVEVPVGSVEVPTEDVDTLFRSPQSGFSSARRDVIQSAEAWTAAWDEANSLVMSTEPNPAPEIDFGSTQVLVISLGVRPSGGHDIEVTSLAVRSDTLFATVRSTAPGTGCVTTSAVTHPAVMLSVPVTDGVVHFVEEAVTVEC